MEINELRVEIEKLEQKQLNYNYLFRSAVTTEDRLKYKSLEKETSLRKDNLRFILNRKLDKLC